MNTPVTTRNHPSYWAFIVHRVSGLALACFLPVHLAVVSRSRAKRALGRVLELGRDTARQTCGNRSCSFAGRPYIWQAVTPLGRRVLAVARQPEDFHRDCGGHRPRIRVIVSLESDLSRGRCADPISDTHKPTSLILGSGGAGSSRLYTPTRTAPGKTSPSRSKACSVNAAAPVWFKVGTTSCYRRTIPSNVTLWTRSKAANGSATRTSPGSWSISPSNASTSWKTNSAAISTAIRTARSARKLSWPDLR